jgi:hypothetical protein
VTGAVGSGFGFLGTLTVPKACNSGPCQSRHERGCAASSVSTDRTLVEVC